MYEVKANIEKNRLYIKLSGNITLEEANPAVQAVMDETDKLKPGFDVINDISQFRPVSQDVTKKIQSAQEYLNKSKVRNVVRIVSDDAMITSQQFKRTGTMAGYQAKLVTSLEEAEKILDNPE